MLLRRTAFFAYCAAGEKNNKSQVHIRATTRYLSFTDMSKSCQNLHKYQSRFDANVDWLRALIRAVGHVEFGCFERGPYIQTPFYDHQLNNHSPVCVTLTLSQPLLYTWGLSISSQTLHLNNVTRDPKQRRAGILLRFDVRRTCTSARSPPVGCRPKSTSPVDYPFQLTTFWEFQTLDQFFVQLDYCVSCLDVWKFWN